MRLPITLAAGTFAAIIGNAHALTLAQSDLPTALAGCASATCVVDLDSTTDTGFMSTFMLARMRPDNTGYDFRWLLRYQLTPPSALTAVADPDYGTSGTTPYTGQLWLETPQTLDLNGQNLFQVYTDHVTPDPDASYFADGLATWVFGMDTLAAIGGGGSYYYSGSDGYGDLVEYGNLAVLGGLPICIECGIDVRLNLVGLDYAANGTSAFDPTDGRSLLLQYQEFYDYFNDTHAFHVQAVPLPAAAWLFGWGLVSIGLTMRKMRGRNTT